MVYPLVVNSYLISLIITYFLKSLNVLCAPNNPYLRSPAMQSCLTWTRHCNFVEICTHISIGEGRLSLWHFPHKIGGFIFTTQLYGIRSRIGFLALAGASVCLQCNKLRARYLNHGRDPRFLLLTKRITTYPACLHCRMDQRIFFSSLLHLEMHVEYLSIWHWPMECL